ncbi:hypothetical protein TWF696_009253 [Orbilia brochopaga]|uniref:Uncharacterized protein n=1 Tax=Orbilia brochopaga TaxID=3140254 RepID=A0AAV9UI51_9PEZI
MSEIPSGTTIIDQLMTAGRITSAKHRRLDRHAIIDMHHISIELFPAPVAPAEYCPGMGPRHGDNIEQVLMSSNLAPTVKGIFIDPRSNEDGEPEVWRLRLGFGRTRDIASPRGRRCFGIFPRFDEKKEGQVR